MEVSQPPAQSAAGTAPDADSRVEMTSLKSLGGNGGYSGASGLDGRVIVRKSCPEIPIFARVREFESVKASLLANDEFEIDDAYLDMGDDRSAWMQCICTQTIRHVHFMRSKRTGIPIVIGENCAERTKSGFGKKCQMARRKRCKECNEHVEDLRGNKARAKGGPYCEDCWDCMEARGVCVCGRQKGRMYSGQYFAKCYSCSRS